MQILCPKWLIDSDNSVLNFMFFLHTCHSKRFFFSKRLNSSQRIGPHNINVISLIVGSLLKNSFIEKREHGIRIIFVKQNNNVEYLMWFHSVLFNAGYCSKEKPKLYKLIGKGNKVFFIYSFKSYSFSSFNWLYDMFYRDNVKIIPRYLDEYLTPLALSTLFLSPVIPEKKGLKLPKSFISVEDLNYLSLVLNKKYNIKTILRDSNFDKSKYSNVSLHIENRSFSTFSKIVKPHLLHSQYHLLNRPILKFTFPGSNIHSYFHISKRGFSSKKNLSDIKYTINYKKEYVLRLEQKEALIGIILGDGFLERVKPNHNTRLRIEQSYPEKEKYLRSLYDLLEPLTTMSPTILTRKDKRSSIKSQSLYFRTLAMPCLNDYYDLFYKEKVKVIPRNLSPLLTARGLAYLIMDDGGKSVHNQTVLHTRSFTLEDVKYFQSVLLENFDLVTRLEEKKKDQWVIYIPVRQVTKLKDIVGPYMHKSMLYKI
uniref:LAGLIDADG endonuclease n=1 Tax=Coniothyrium glycines TaxID=1077358 RepID=A0A3G4S724_9PLEO|nr:LAGLIDADG endonuclease [Coniothyrium glycines]AYU74396.1 LAGLIDADG endonuclease [Coniothyrium glycines]